MSTNTLPLLCIGSVLWDIIGKSEMPMVQGDDRPGRIRKIPGGVALNIAMALRKHQLDIELLSTVGLDSDGDALLNELQQMGLGTKFLHRSADHPTDFYMAVESPNGVLGAIADAHSLENVGDEILLALRDGRLGSTKDPFGGSIVLDGNLTTELLTEISKAPEFKQASIFVAPASPGKAERLQPFLGKRNAAIFVNKEEADILGGSDFQNSAEAAETLFRSGLRMVVVTDGGRPATCASEFGLTTLSPDPVTVKRFTGAGDCFMAAFVYRYLQQASDEDCLRFSLEQTNKYISTE